jgi:hypothetical protein
MIDSTVIRANHQAAGARVGTHNQNVMVTAIQMAERKSSLHLS